MPLYECFHKKPEKNWKKDLALSLPLRQKKKPKRLSMCGARKRIRIQKEGSETDFFKRIWQSRPHICEICGKQIIEAHSYCFAHNLAKGLFPNYRLYEKNITLVCSIRCHLAVDKKYQSIESRTEFEKFLNS